MAVNKNYPGHWRVTVTRAIAAGDTVVTEAELRSGDSKVTAVSFFTLRDGRIVHLRELWPEPYEAQAWRAQWVER